MPEFKRGALRITLPPDFRIEEPPVPFDALIWTPDGDGEKSRIVAGWPNDGRLSQARKPDKIDREAVCEGSYVVVLDGSKERLYHVAFLRADGGSLEISKALEALGESR